MTVDSQAACFDRLPSLDTGTMGGWLLVARIALLTVCCCFCLLCVLCVAVLVGDLLVCVRCLLLAHFCSGLLQGPTSQCLGEHRESGQRTVGFGVRGLSVLVLSDQNDALNSNVGLAICTVDCCCWAFMFS